MSDSFEVYLRNTHNITVQYATALDEVHQHMNSMAIDATNFQELIYAPGRLDLKKPMLEDED